MSTEYCHSQIKASANEVGLSNSAITAFPVLARILTELEMLHNHVGVVTLAAGVGNDVV